MNDNNSSNNRAPVIIIGAGPAGLTAAYEYSKAGGQSLILEADSQVGGLSRTVNYRGYRFDIGGHRFFSKNPYVNELWKEILHEDFLIQPRLSRIHYRGHFFDYPLKPLNALSGLGAVEAARVILSYGRIKMMPGGMDDNFEDWVSNRFGKRLYELFFKTYTEKVWGMSCREISSDWAAQRIKNLSLKEVLRNTLLGAEKSGNGDLITTLIDRFHYPRTGPGMMWERCADILSQQGSTILFGFPIQHIRHRNRKIECIHARNLSGGWEEFQGKQFISTMPLRELICALDPPAPAEVLRAANNLHYRDYLTVVLIINRENVFPDNWIYIHTPDVKMGRVQNYKNWSSAMVPDLSRTSLGLEYFLWDNDEEWNWPDERLIEMGVRECERIGLIEPWEVEDGTVVRMKKAYPIYDQNYQANLALIRQYLEGFSNLQTIGRNGLHRYNNQDHSMLTGVYAARNIWGANYDVWSVNTEREYHEESRLRVSAGGDRVVPTQVKPASESRQSSYDAIVEDSFAGEVIEEVFARLDVLAAGIAVGIVSGLAVFLATIILLLKGGPVVGPRLSLLGQYFLGYDVSWQGAFIGLVEAGVAGFGMGALIAWLRNRGMRTYAILLRRRAESQQRQRLLDKI